MLKKSMDTQNFLISEVPTVATIKIMVLSDVLHAAWHRGASVLEEHTASIFRLEK
jgi:hypothetical protein